MKQKLCRSDCGWSAYVGVYEASRDRPEPYFDVSGPVLIPPTQVGKSGCGNPRAWRCEAARAEERDAAAMVTRLTTFRGAAATAAVAVGLVFHLLLIYRAGKRKPAPGERRKSLPARAAGRGIVAAIGNTPLIRIESLSKETGCEVTPGSSLFFDLSLWFSCTLVNWMNWFCSDSCKSWVLEPRGEHQGQNSGQNNSGGESPF